MAENGEPMQDDEREPGPVRGQPGAYLEDGLHAEVLSPFSGLLMGTCMLLGAGLHHWLGWLPVLGAGVVWLAGAAYLWFSRKRRRDALRKGHVAERQVGRALEQAITAAHCAVAHNVTGVMDSGDIDHIVATRQCVRVIETKYRRVPKPEFGSVLSRLHACRHCVEALLPRGTPVKACLVLAYEGGGVGGEQEGIEVFNNETFREELLPKLRAERNEGPRAAGIDERAARAIWGLSRSDGAPAVEAPEDRDRREGHDVGGAHRRFPRAYERWTAEEDRRLRDLHEAGWDETELASEFGRQPSAIRSRLRKLAE